MQIGMEELEAAAAEIVRTEATTNMLDDLTPFHLRAYPTVYLSYTWLKLSALGATEAAREAVEDVALSVRRAARN